MTLHPTPDTQSNTAEQPQFDPCVSIESLQRRSELFADEVLQNTQVQQKKEQCGPWKELFLKARLTRAKQAIRGALECTPPALIRRWVCDCIEPALYLYEEQFHDDRPRKALQVARSFTERKANKLQRAHEMAFDAEQEALDAFDEYETGIPARRKPDGAGWINFDYREECLMEQAACIARAVRYATMPDEVFLRKAPETEDLTEGPMLAARALVESLIFDAAGLARIPSIEAKKQRVELLSEMVERQAVLLSSYAECSVSPEERLSWLSRFRRLELASLYQKEQEEQTRARILDSLGRGGSPRLRRQLPNEVTPYDQALDPKTPPEDLLNLSDDYPAQVAKNPALPTIERQDPELFEEITHSCELGLQFREIEVEIQELTRKQRTRWACLCAHRTLSTFEESLYDRRPSELLRIAAACAVGQESKKRLREAILVARASRNDAQNRVPSSLHDIRQVISRVNWRLAIELAMQAANTVLEASDENTYDCAISAACLSRDSLAECFWLLNSLHEIKKTLR